MERISRSIFINAGIGSILTGGEAAWATRFFNAKYSLNGPKMESLRKIGESLIPHLSLAGFDKPIDAEGTQLKVALNRGALSHLLLAMAYLDGGDERVDQVKSALIIEGLKIEIKKEGDKIGGTFHISSIHDVPAKGLQRFRIAVNPTVLAEYALALRQNEIVDQTVVPHELYHLIQFVRDRRLFKTFQEGSIFVSYFMAPVAYGIFIGYLGFQISRRRLFTGVLPAGLVGSIVYREFVSDTLNAFINPVENQAHVQTGLGLDGTIGTEKHIVALNQQLFTFSNAE